MSNDITFIFRKRLPQYNSIEELFGSVAGEISKRHLTDNIELKYSGASPSVLFKNLLNFKKREGTVYHITGDVHYMALRTGKHTVLTIHDVKSASQKNIIKQGYVRLFWFWLPALFVKRITVISEFTKAELCKIIPFASHKIHVVHNPVNAALQPCDSVFNQEKPHILLIGTKPNKNLERSLKALANFPCRITIVGKLSMAQKHLLTDLKLEFTNRVNLNFDEIVACYQSCDLLCFASTYEGFGMPIIEAQAVGRPVITSNFGAMSEVAVDSVCMVDAYDVESILEGVEKVCNDQHFREELIRKGFENVKRFQLSNIAETYLKIYDEVLTQ